MAVRRWSHKPGCLALAIILNLLWAGLVNAQSPSEIPDKFDLDMRTAAQLRPALLAQSAPATGRYAIGRLVLETLVAQARTPRGVRLNWELRIANDDLLNAYSSPDGTIYVDRGLAELVGSSSGLWAAVLSHEIAHIERRDWARRYLYQESLKNGSGGTLLLGDPGLISGDWMDSRKASEELAVYCRRLEVDADRESLKLMARAGYHPDFVPALHHLLHAYRVDTSPQSMTAMHPCWETRDAELRQAYITASLEFERGWNDWASSPGGNPPVVIFAGQATVRKTADRQWEIILPLRCDNLVGVVEVLLKTRDAGTEFRQVTGCTSPQTLITFLLSEDSSPKNAGSLWTDIYVRDDQGAVLSRADVPKSRR